MAWTAPKVDWTAAPGVAYSDLNEIGENLVYLKSHADATAGVHGGVTIATPSTFMVRNAAGRATVVAPAAETDIALKSNVTAEATARVVADGLQDVTIAGLGTDKVAKVGDTMAGALEAFTEDGNYTAGIMRNIKLLTAVPNAGTDPDELDYGEIGMVYEV